MIKFERYGYAVQKSAGRVVLTYETRIPFTLDSGPVASGQKGRERTRVSARERTRVSARADSHPYLVF